MIIKLSFMSPVMRQFTCVQIANMSMICLGMNVVWSSPMLIKLSDPEQTILPQPITEEQSAWIASINMLAGLIAVFVNGFFIDNIGRRNTLLISYVPRIVSCFLAVFASQYWMILVSRSLGGICEFLALTALTTYSSEISGKAIRGATGTMTQINSAIGMLIMLGVGPFVSYVAMNTFMTCFAIAAVIPLLFMPESPLFLHTKGQTNKSVEVLTFLHGTEDLAHEEIKGYSRNDEDKPNIWQLLKDRTVIKTFIIVIFLTSGLQLSGYNVVNIYLQTILETANTSVSSEISSLIIGAIQLLACFCTFFLTNRFGRKTIICTSIAGMLVGMIGLGTFFTFVENDIEIKGFLNFLPLISVAIVIYGYNAGLGSLFWMLVAELFYGPVRPYGMSVCAFVYFITGFGMAFVFPTLNAAVGAAGTYWIFSAGCVLVCAFVAIFVPETKNKTFADIQRALGRKESTIKA